MKTTKHLTYLEIIFRAVMWALLFLVIGAGGDYLADRLGWQRDLIYLNDVVSSIFIAVLIVLYEQRRRKRIQERVQIIREINHHVRNALQVISFSHHAHERDENLKLIQEAVSRIDWALREILPGIEVGSGRPGPLINQPVNRPTQ